MSWNPVVTNRKTSGVSHVEVSRHRHGQRLDNFLSARLKGVPRSLIYRLIRTGQVRVNGGRARPSRRLETGDMVRIPPAKMRGQGNPDIPRKAIDLLAASICFDDGDIMVVDKPAGMAVHGGSGVDWGVVDVVRRLRPAKQVDLVHRLDRVTSGCLLIALSGAALKWLNDQLAAQRIDKRYLCLLDGVLPQSVVEVDEPIGRSERAGERLMQVDPAGKPAHTTFSKLHDYGSCSYAEANLHSGRTHQIRVHAAHLGMALAGDRVYAPAARQDHWRQMGLSRLFLHAHQVSFTTLDGAGQLVSAALPDDLRTFLDTLA